MARVVVTPVSADMLLLEKTLCMCGSFGLDEGRDKWGAISYECAAYLARFASDRKALCAHRTALKEIYAWALDRR